MFKKLLISSLIGISFFSVNTYANSPVHGGMYGENIGVIHFDYTTANESEYETLPLAGIRLGSRQEFLISPADLWYKGAGTSGSTASIGTTGTSDCTSSFCYFEGFMWSDAIGWISMGNYNGESNTHSLEAAINIKGGTFDESMRARVMKDTGIFKGYMWSEKTGWIKLSSDGFTKTDTENQNKDNWGVWINLNDETESISSKIEGLSDVNEDDCDAMTNFNNRFMWDKDINEGECVETPLEIGRKLRGMAWSEKLGWIKFEKKDGDTTNFIGGYTQWIPDNTPPVPTLVDNAWFAVGVNTGNHSDLSTIVWENIFEDPETGINASATSIIIKPADGFEENCFNPTVSSNKNDKSLNITIPLVGNVKNPAYIIGENGDGTDNQIGYCKYELTGTIINGGGMEFIIEEDSAYTFYVRAGDYTSVETEFIGTDETSGSLADGEEENRFIITPLDIAGNPIVDINCMGENIAACINGEDVRDVIITANVNNTMRYDSTHESISNTTSIKFGEEQQFAEGADENEEQINMYNEDDEVTIGDEYISIIPEDKTKREIILKSYSPTTTENTTINNKFTLNSYSFDIKDGDLLEVSSDGYTVIADPTEDKYLADITDQSAIFNPILKVTDYLLGDNNEKYILGNSKIAFTLENLDDKTLNNIDIDTEFSFNDSSRLDFKDITINENDIISKNNLGWSDFIVAGLGGAKYELYIGSNGNETINGSNSIFGNGISDTDGKYTDASFIGIPKCNSYDEETGGCLDETGYIYRSHIASSDLSLKAINTLSTSEKTIFFEGKSILGGLQEDIKLTIDQIIGYRVDDQPQFTIYKPDVLVNEINVQDIGVGTSGNVSGDVYGNTGIETVGTTSAEELFKQMRKNVADLTINKEEDEYCIGNNTINSLEDEGGCIRVNETEKTIIAYYKGTNDERLTLSGGSTITAPAGYKYTIILEGGLNLEILSNIILGDDGYDTSLGIIAINTDTNNKGGSNIIIGKDPTNIMAYIYTEGSLLADETDTDGLKNQLLLEGSLASRNTIGGVEGGILPNGVKCEAGVNETDCIKKYDLNYIRRFSINSDGTTIANEGLFSGGGSCDGTDCTNGTLSTSITFKADNTIDKNNSLSIDPFFIKQMNRTMPAGFSTNIIQKSTDVIR